MVRDRSGSGTNPGRIGAGPRPVRERSGTGPGPARSWSGTGPGPVRGRIGAGPRRVRDRSWTGQGPVLDGSGPACPPQAAQPSLLPTTPYTHHRPPKRKLGIRPRSTHNHKHVPDGHTGHQPDVCLRRAYAVLTRFKGKMLGEETRNRHTFFLTIAGRIDAYRIPGPGPGWGRVRDRPGTGPGRVRDGSGTGRGRVRDRSGTFPGRVRVRDGTGAGPGPVRRVMTGPGRLRD